MSTVIAPDINGEKFYDSVRVSVFRGKLKQAQVDSMDEIFSEWDKRAVCDLRWLAYMFATVYHETAGTMQAIEEYGKGRGYKYGQKIKMNGKPYTTPNRIYYGRGFVQLTWYENYEAMGKRLKVDLLNEPELALDTRVATQILFEGMLFGLFTGKKLADYFLDNRADAYNARRIINGTDKAELIAGYYRKFHAALT